MRSTLHDPQYKPRSKKYLHNDLFGTQDYNLVVISKNKYHSLFKVKYSTIADWNKLVYRLQIAGWFYEEEFRCSVLLKTFDGFNYNIFTDKCTWVFK